MQRKILSKTAQAKLLNEYRMQVMAARYGDYDDQREEGLIQYGRAQGMEIAALHLGIDLGQPPINELVQADIDARAKEDGQ